jgi:hypothetical protein
MTFTRHIGGKFCTPKEKGIGTGVITHGDLREHSTLEDEIEPGTLELFFEAEDLVKGARFFRIGVLQGKC